MKNKKLITAVLSLVMVFPSIVNVSYAASDKTEYYEYMSKYTGLPVSELQDVESKHGDLSKYFNIEIPAEKLELAAKYRSADTNNKALTAGIELPAATAKDQGYFEALSAYTGISVSELKKLKKEHGDLNKYFGFETVKNAAADTQQSKEVVINSDGDGSSKMTSSDWSYMLGKADKGDILVSKDQTTYVLWVIGVNHGHAAIVYTDSARTVEALGDPYNSDDYDISRWSNRYTMRDYYPVGTSSFRESAANYAYNNLRGKPYKATANRTDTEYLQCANLVWQAYKSQNYVLDYAPAGWATPMTFVQDTDLSLWAGVNWSTGAHTW
ncbi:uncharacterized protein YycO [Paenibacillus forsythiae]|uniref:Uncharacterized protein YycO n=1 Tax=Paenibacillus forsythiae TaxID=365616 RepID=A0ABU3H2E0_9BACL|nr:hypothetical protein [Paenibacillus forsythiae]MDT3424990.1 uncharacterized protein YycO [Paenibacillus forsythiae]